MTDFEIEKLVKKPNQEEQELNKDAIKTYSVMINMVVISFGFMQFGIGLGSWGCVTGAFACMHNWSDHEHTLFDSIVTGV